MWYTSNGHVWLPLVWYEHLQRTRLCVRVCAGSTEVEIDMHVRVSIAHTYGVHGLHIARAHGFDVHVKK